MSDAMSCATCGRQESACECGSKLKSVTNLDWQAQARAWQQAAQAAEAARREVEAEADARVVEAIGIERDRCAKLICPECKRGYGIEKHPNLGWAHDHGEGVDPAVRWTKCEASVIW